jgi:hypothetical protein
MQWKPFVHQGKMYPLDHLHPFSFDLVIPAKNSNPQRCYQINIGFSLHCFSRSPAKDEAIPADLSYSDSRETRVFDFYRYQLSLGLPGIVRNLADRPCFHDRHGNFYVFEILDDDGVTRYYSVFFTLSKAGKKAGLNLFISSAYVKDERPYARNVKPIRFRILVHNTWIRKGIRPAP